MQIQILFVRVPSFGLDSTVLGQRIKIKPVLSMCLLQNIDGSDIELVDISIGSTTPR